MTTISPEVRLALRNLALDLKLNQRAGMLNWASAGRALEAYDLRLEKAGYAEDGVTKLASTDDLLTKANDRIAELEKQARPGGPARFATKQKHSAPTQADMYRLQAEQATDPVLRRGYTQLANKLEKGNA